MRVSCGFLLICAATFCAAPAVHADLVATVNSIRAQGCAGQSPAKTTVRPDRTLDDVARRWSGGGRLGGAIERSGYRAASSTSVHVQGTTDDAAIRRILGEQYCTAVNNPRFSEIGVFQRGDESWIVLADPFAAPTPGDPEAVGLRVLELVNAARAEARRCGRRKYDATHPLQLSATLASAASIHARDMGTHGSMEHRGSDGSTPAERVTRVGYRWLAVAENIAAGQPNADAVVAGWLDSPGHCANIMGAQFTEMGVAFVVDPRSNPAIYWAQVFAMPQ